MCTAMSSRNCSLDNLIGEALLILKRRGHSATVVPSLVPAKAHHFMIPSLQLGKVRSEVAEHILHVPKHLLVIWPKFPA